MQPPPPSSPRAPSPSGFALLAVLLLLAALAMLIGVSMQVGMDSRHTASRVTQEATAAAIAEAGLDRTRAYLSGVLAERGDLDRVLDPNLDTDCTDLAALANLSTTVSGTEDDYLPPFTDGLRLEYPAGSGRAYRFVPSGGGAYLVRVDDNDDDLYDSELLAGLTDNNDVNNCLEGPSLLMSNPVRDRDSSAVITAIGVFPLNVADLTAPLDPAQVLARVERARVRKVLRARIGPMAGVGVIVGGDFKLGGNSRVCGEYGNVASTGNLISPGGGNAELCSGSCNPDTSCTATSSGTCQFTGGTCLPNSEVPPPPPVRLWSSINAPPKCTAAPCIPFYYARHHNDGSGDTIQVFMWNYAVCPDPRRDAVIPTPNDPAPSPPANPLLPGPCWTLVLDTKKAKDALCTSNDKAIHLKDDVALTAQDPSTLRPLLFPDYSATPVTCPQLPAANFFLELTSYGTPTQVAPATDCTALGPYPDTAVTANLDLQYNKLSNNDFKYVNPGVLIPRGVWLIEGNLVMEQATPTCAVLGPLINTPPPTPSWGVSMMATGNILINDPVSLEPIHPRGLVLLAGRDMKIDQGNTAFETCVKGGALMVHEQLELKGNGVISAQLVVESATNCTSTVSANDLSGTTEINVSKAPPIPMSGSAILQSWSESSL